MIRRGWQSTVRWVLCGTACALPGCASSDDGMPRRPAEYILGGQTGSLVPSCGVAPLSQSGQAVPLSDALAVLYTSGCPEGGAQELLTLTGPDTLEVGLTLEPLEGSGVFLVRADQSLDAGQYELALPNSSSSSLVVAEAASPLPTRLGELGLLGETAECAESLMFEWELTEEALAHAPLLRLWVRVDEGREQLWIEYGALEIEPTATGGRGLLHLPRCGESSCLDGGAHVLELRAELAGETIPPEPLQARFDVRCTAAASRADEVDSRYACAFAGPARTLHFGAIFSCAVLALARLRRRRSSRTCRR